MAKAKTPAMKTYKVTVERHRLEETTVVISAESLDDAEEKVLDLMDRDGNRYMWTVVREEDVDPEYECVDFEAVKKGEVTSFPEFAPILQLVK